MFRIRHALLVALVAVCAASVGAGSAFAAMGMNRIAAGAGAASSTVAFVSNLPASSPAAQASISMGLPGRSTIPSTQPAISCHCSAATRLPPPLPPAPALDPVVPAYAPDPAGGVPDIWGDVILVSLPQQWLWVYQNKTLVYATPVTSGMPELPTPTGIFHVLWRVQNTTFYSPWPQGSPYYYPPEHVDYALYFKDYGFFLHNAPWRHCFGPGTNVPHTCPDGTQETGSHGCVNLPTPAGAWLYAYVPNGAVVDIRG